MCGICSNGRALWRFGEGFGKISCFKMMNHTMKQVETLFGELKYIEPRLKALGLGN